MRRRVCVNNVYAVEVACAFVREYTEFIYGLRVGRLLDVGLPFDSMLPVSSATRALILATRDSIAVLVSVLF